MRNTHHPHPLKLTHLYNVMHVWQETVQANFQQHDESSAHILPHFWFLVCRQCKQVLQRIERQQGQMFSLHRIKQKLSNNNNCVSDNNNCEACKMSFRRNMNGAGQSQYSLVI